MIMILLALGGLVLIAFALVVLYFWGINPGELTIFLTHDYSFTMPTGILVVVVALCGLLLGFGAFFMSSLVVSFKHWKGGRKLKKSEEISSIYRNGVGRLLSGDLKKSRSLLQKVIDRDPKRVDGYLALANVAVQEGENQEAIDLLQKARKVDPRGLEVLFKLAGIFEQAGRTAEAMGIYRELLSKDSDNRKAMRALRDLEIDLGNLDEALGLQKRILKVSTSGPRAEQEKAVLYQLRYEVARNQLEAGEAEAVIEVCKDIIKQSPTFTPARVTLGDAYRQAGKNSEAAKVYEDGYKSLQKSIFLARLEDLYINVEDPAALLAFYRGQMQADESDLLLRLYLGRLCLRLEMVDEAMEYLSDLEARGIEFTKLHLLLAEAQRRRNNVEEAVSEYQKALGINHHLTLGYVCESCGARFSEWQSRCPSCRNWDTMILPERKQMENANALEQPKMIPHGAREAE